MTPELFLVFHQVLRFLFLPTSAALSLCHLGFALSQLIIDRDEKNHIKTRHAVLLAVNFISSCLVIAIVIGTLAFATAFHPAFPFLVGANLILTGGYQFLTMAYLFYQAHQKEKLAKQATISAEQRETLLHEAKQERYIAKIRFLFGVTVLFFAASTIAVLSTGILPLASIGLTGAVIGIALCLYGLQRLWKDTPEKKYKKKADSPFSSTTTQLLEADYFSLNMLRHDSPSPPLKTCGKGLWRRSVSVRSAQEGKEKLFTSPSSSSTMRSGSSLGSHTPLLTIGPS
jgi:hypothetical protein